jgi:exopolyphosphatase/guanosine-5'-triphosphate,3'-diphosphate pyrophosphatase
MTVLAALDLGTNSFHMVVARRAGGGFEVLTREKDMVRLGHGGGEMKHLEPDAIERGVASLRRMKQIADSHKATVRAVATSAVREAENADEFIRRARREAGIEVEVISGIEEARLIHLGVLQAVPAFEQRLLLVDIGGGSTEVLIGERGETLAARSFKLGAVRLTDRFFPGGDVTPAAVTSCRNYIRSALTAFEREVAELGHDVAIASSGTAEAVARMIHAATGAPELRTFNCYEFTKKELAGVVDAVIGAPTAAARRDLPGLEPARTDIVVAGALVLEGVAATFGISRFTLSEYALREGLLLDTVQRSDAADSGHLLDVSRRSIRQLAQRCDDDTAHSANVARLAAQIFDQTRDLHRLGDSAADYLEAGALLANVGLVVSHSRHHLHSYYLVRNSELVGLTDHEIELIAQIARYHRKSAPKPSHPEFAALGPDDQRMVRVLAGMLRVAIGLDRSHTGRVRTVTVDDDGEVLTITAKGPRAADLSLELYAANERSGLLADALGRRVEVVSASGARQMS